jgi:hypothetical protein
MPRAALLVAVALLVVVTVGSDARSAPVRVLLIGRFPDPRSALLVPAPGLSCAKQSAPEPVFKHLEQAMEEMIAVAMIAKAPSTTLPRPWSRSYSSRRMHRYVRESCRQRRPTLSRMLPQHQMMTMPTAIAARASVRLDRTGCCIQLAKVGLLPHFAGTIWVQRQMIIPGSDDASRCVPAGMPAQVSSERGDSRSATSADPLRKRGAVAGPATVAGGQVESARASTGGLATEAGASAAHGAGQDHRASSAEGLEFGAVHPLATPGAQQGGEPAAAAGKGGGEIAEARRKVREAESKVDAERRWVRCCCGLL